MSGFSVNSHHLFSLDALLDTRLGTVAKLSQKAALRLMEDNTYHQREIDSFQDDLLDISKEEYVAAWEARDKFTLAASVPTHLISFLQKCVMDDMNDANFNAQDRDFKISINIWPYELNETERKDLVSSMHDYFPGYLDIQAVNIPMGELTPLYLKTANITNLVIYDLDAWMNSHKTALEQCLLPDVTIIAPELLREPVRYDKVNAEYRDKVKELGPFRSAEMMSMPYCNLHLVPAALWCAGLIKLVKRA